MPSLSEKIKENILVMLPIIIIVTLLNFTLIPLGTITYLRFLISSIIMILGLSIFLVGVDLGVTPLGAHTGKAIIRPNKLWIIVLAGLGLGFLISIAEPGLLVFANQVSFVTEGHIKAMKIIVWVSIGLALMVGLGFIRILYNWSLSKILIILYSIIALMVLFVSPEFLSISFDAAGATTGIIAVPFLLALSMGLSKLKKDQLSSQNDAFGLVSIASAGAIISLLVLGYLTKDFQYDNTIDWGFVEANSLWHPLLEAINWAIQESIIGLSPLIIVLFAFQLFVFKLPNKVFYRMLKGFIYTFIGLAIFLTGTNGGFMIVGAKLGNDLLLLTPKYLVIIIAFFIGLLTIMAEPAVSILTHQIEDVTSGYVKRKLVLITIALGVGMAIALSVVKILIPPLQLWHILLPGYLLALLLMLFTPKLFIGIAFDAGGVATGPLTATFTLAFVQGVANAHPGASVVLDGFGMIALVALAPIITLQLLGVAYLRKTKKRGIK